MVKKIISLCISIIFTLSIFLISACAGQAKSIRSFYINEKGELVVTYSDNMIENLGSVKGENEQTPSDCLHSFEEWETKFAATCESIGYDTRICSLCGELEYRFHSSTGHLYDNPIEIINTREQHIVYKTCVKCGDTCIEDLGVDDLNHKSVYYGTEDDEGNKNPFQYMDIYIPSGLEEGEKVPVVVTIHGGNWSYYYDETGAPVQNKNTNRVNYEYITDFIVNSNDDAQLSGCNFVQVNIDYRPLYCEGTDPNAQVYKDKTDIGFARDYKDMLQDISAAIEYICQNADTYHINTEKIALMGVSAGAHLALLYAYKNPSQIKVVVSEAGPTYLVDILYNVIMIDAAICAMAGLEYRGNEYIYAPNDVYNPNVHRDMEDAKILREVSPLWVASDFLNTQTGKPEEERIALPYTILAYGGVDNDRNGAIDINSSDGWLPFEQSTELLNTLTKENCTRFELINATHADFGAVQESSTQITPYSKNDIAKEYYYGKDDGNGEITPGLQQLLCELLA